MNDLTGHVGLGGTVYEQQGDIVSAERFGQAKAELGGGFSRIVGYYKDDGERVISEIERAVRNRSAVCMVRPAHTLKGDSLMLGADALGLAAEEIEKAARLAVESHDFPDHVLTRVLELRRLFLETLAYFDRELAPRGPVPLAPVRRQGGFGRKVI